MVIKLTKNGKTTFEESAKPGLCPNCNKEIKHWSDDFESFEDNHITCTTDCPECDHSIEDTYVLVETNIEKIEDMDDLDDPDN